MDSIAKREVVINSYHHSKSWQEYLTLKIEANKTEYYTEL
jgi:hypothetical protein